jgi:hypothetical protein
MKKFHVNTSKIDTVFIAFLFLIFALTASALVLLMATQYRATVNSMNENYEVRTASSYLAEKVRSHDSAESVSVEDLDGITVLALSENAKESDYTTYIYYYGGALRELLIGSDAAFMPDAGQSIVTLQDFCVEDRGEGLLYITFTDSAGLSHEQYLTYHTPAGKEAA